MQPISGKVKASSAAASVSTVITGILAPHIFPHTMASDVRGLIAGAITGGVTFAFGWLAKHGIDGAQLATDVEDMAADLGVPFTSVREAEESVPADAAPAVAQPVA
jgi:hypothetical protein